MTMYTRELYTPHEGTMYVSLTTPSNDLARSIVVAFGRNLEKGIDVSFMGDVALKHTYAACLEAQAIIESQNPSLSVVWKLFRRGVKGRNSQDTLVADFFRLIIVPKESI